MDADISGIYGIKHLSPICPVPRLVLRNYLHDIFPVGIKRDRHIPPVPSCFLQYYFHTIYQAKYTRYCHRHPS